MHTESHGEGECFNIVPGGGGGNTDRKHLGGDNNDEENLETCDILEKVIAFYNVTFCKT